MKHGVGPWQVLSSRTFGASRFTIDGVKALSKRYQRIKAEGGKEWEDLVENSTNSTAVAHKGGFPFGKKAWRTKTVRRLPGALRPGVAVAGVEPHDSHDVPLDPEDELEAALDLATLGVDATAGASFRGESKPIANTGPGRRLVYSASHRQPAQRNPSYQCARA